MGLRPVPARWFEAIVPRDGVSQLVEALARSGAVEIECEHDVEPGEAGLREALAELEKLARRYEPYWPVDGMRGTVGPPIVVLGHALQRLRTWAVEAEPIIREIEAIEAERAGLQLLLELLEAAGGEADGLELLGTAGPTLSARVLALPRGSRPLPEPREGVRTRHWSGSEHEFLLLLGPPSAVAAMELEATALAARAVDVQAAPLRLGAVRGRLEALSPILERTRERLDAIGGAHRLASALADFRRLRWFIETVPPLPHTRHFARITGWTTDMGGACLEESLRRSEVPALLCFPEPPAGRTAPLVLRNPGFIRPFEAFARLLGMPGCAEADPTPLVAVIAPLLFGFMFGDLGHGLLLAAVGAFGGRRWPAVRMLVPGGLSAAVFGLLYGCVFTREDLIPALWIRPFEEPVTLLAVAVVLGAAILVLGLLISALEAGWQGTLGKWWLTDAALLLVYLGLLGSIVHPAGVLAALAGTLWFVVGSGIAAERNRAQAALASIGHLIERTVQLLLNTVSFARVGAFALAHAGLSVAVAGLGAAFDDPTASVVAVVLGNVLILVLEGLVVSIQTTRLVLFEFFVRFLRSTGRPFRPLRPPPTGEPEEGAVHG